jgi:regulator of sigma E protease
MTGPSNTREGSSGLPHGNEVHVVTIISAIVLLGVIIFVHEFGHFVFAKALGVKVERFSLGFGPKLFGFQIGETEYRVSAVPLGGYVKMLGENPEEDEDAPPLSEEDQRRSFGAKRVWRRAAIVFAGPFFNVAFAVVVFIFIYMAGVPVPYPDIGVVDDKSPAQQAGLKPGDRVLAIDGRNIDSYDEIEAAVQDSAGKPLAFRVKRGDKELDLTVTPELTSGRNLFGETVQAGSIGAQMFLPPQVGQVMGGTPAESAGLEKGDVFVRIDGKQIETWQDMTYIVHSSPGKKLHFVIKRGDRTIEKDITPEASMPPGAESEIGLIGIRAQANTFIHTFGVMEAVKRGFGKTVDLSVLTVVAVVKLVQRVIPADTLGGPILIVQMAGQQAGEGVRNFFSFMALISVNLGIINLFPIPILDGGHLLFFGIEAVRRRPLAERTIIVAQKVGLVLILMIMAFAIYNDVVRVVTGKGMP